MNIFAKVAAMALVVGFAPLSAYADRGGHGWHGNKNHGYSHNSYSHDSHGHSDSYGNSWNRPRYENRPLYSGGYPNGAYKGDHVVRNGIRNGNLTYNEVRNIREDQRELQEKRNRYLADGRLSNREREDLRNDYKDYRSDVRHNLNDGERRY